ncbi:MAG: PepSY-associated TM helix domain-containing protein, partial [Perlucidibaca sp.]
MKNLFLRLHGWLGISAGLVLAIVGLTGALLSFEPQILRLLNPGVLVITPESRPMLSPTELYQHVSAARPDQAVRSLTLSGAADRPAQVVYARPGNPRGDAVWVQPYSGELLPAERGHEAFHLIEDIHRELLVEKVGKQITGASALILLFMALSG